MAHVLRQPHLAGAARRVDARAHHRHAAHGAAAGRRALPENEAGRARRRRCASASRCIAPASLLQRLPRRHRSAGLRAGELRRRSAPGATATAMRRARSMPAASLPAAGTCSTGPADLRNMLLAQSRPVRAGAHREADDLRAGSPGAIPRHAARPRHRARRRGARLPLRGTSCRASCTAMPFRKRAASVEAPAATRTRAATRARQRGQTSHVHHQASTCPAARCCAARARPSRCRCSMR